MAAATEVRPERLRGGAAPRASGPQREKGVAGRRGGSVEKLEQTDRRGQE